MRWCCLVLSLVVVGCATPGAFETRVELGLASVQRPADAEQRWGTYETAPTDSTGFSYEDDLVRMVVNPGAGSFSLALENRSEHSMRLMWPDAAFVAPDGVASRLYSGDSTWGELGSPPAPQLIPARSVAVLSLIPERNADRQLLEVRPFFGRQTTCEEALQARMRLVLPLEVEGVVNEYTLNMEPRGAYRVAVRRSVYNQAASEGRREPCPLGG